MNQKADVTFTKKAGLGQGIGFLTIDTEDNEPIQYELNYSAEKGVYERFTFYTEINGFNLSKYLSKWDLERLNEAYFDFRTTNVSNTYLTVQLQSSEAVEMAV